MMMMADCSCECKDGSYETICCNDGAVSTAALTNFSRDDDDDDPPPPAVLLLSEPRFNVNNNCTDVSFRSSISFDHHDHNSTINPTIDNVRATKKREVIIEEHSHHLDPSTARPVDMVTMNTASIVFTPSALIASYAADDNDDDDVTTAVTAYAAVQTTTAATCPSAATAIHDRESSPNYERPIDDEMIEVRGSCNDYSTTNSKSPGRASIKQKRWSDAAGTGAHTSSSSRSSCSSARSSSYSSYRSTSMSCCSSDLNCDCDDDADAPPRRRAGHRSHKFNIHAHSKQASRGSNKLWSRHATHQGGGRCDEVSIIPAMRDKMMMRCDSNDEHTSLLSWKRTRDGRHITDGGCSSTTTAADRGRRQFSDLILSWWERDDDCKDAKLSHVDKIDSFCSEDRERLILLTTLWRQDTVLEPNMFPCE